MKVKRVLGYFLIISFLSCGTLKKESYQDINTIHSNHYSIVKISDKDCNMQASQLRNGSMRFMTFIKGKSLTYKCYNDKETYVIHYSFENGKVEHTLYPEKIINWDSLGYQPAHYPQAKELYYKELLVEEELLPVSRNDSLLYQDMYGNNPKRLEQVLKETKIPKKTVYASIEMPEETLKVKYVQGMYPAFFGTDSLYQKGVLFFYTGAPLPSFEETLQPYSGLYVIRPKK